MKIQQLTALCVLSAVLSGCATQAFTIHHGPVDEEPNKEVSQPFFLSGPGQIQHMDVSVLCRGRQLARVEVREAPLDVLKSLLTLGFYTARTARVYCVEGVAPPVQETVSRPSSAP